MKKVDIDFNGLDLNLIDMNLKTLYYFIIVSETGNITRAAQKLYVTQSMLSKKYYGAGGENRPAPVR